MLLTALTDEEFLRHAQAQHDDLVASAVETELLRRFGALIDRAEVGGAAFDHGLTSADELNATLEQPSEWAKKPVGELTDLLDELEIDDHDTLRRVDAVFNVAMSHDLDTPEALTKELARIRKFDALMNDLTEPLKTLAELAPV